MKEAEEMLIDGEENPTQEQIKEAALEAAKMAALE